jgi:hypothetical protein
LGVSRDQRDAIPPMALSDALIRNAKAGPKPVKLSDGGGLFLLLNPNGSRLWRLKYRFAGKEKLLAFGAYPDVSLKDARESRDDARRQLAAGNDPGQARKASKAAATARAGNSFEVIAREWFELTKAKWESEYANLVLRRLESDIFPQLGGRPIAEIRRWSY